MEHVLPSTVPAPKGATPFDIAMARFLDEAGSDGEIIARRHNMFKIIPRVKEGGWIVKQAVGQNTPVLLGKKLTTKYFRYDALEACISIGHSSHFRKQRFLWSRGMCLSAVTHTEPSFGTCQRGKEFSLATAEVQSIWK